MKTLKFLTLLLISLQLSAQQTNDIHYVTGKLYLTLYSEPNSNSSQIRSLVSGDKLDVIEISGPYAKVKTEYNQTGWVKKGFIVRAKPAILLTGELTKKNKALAEELKLLKEKESAAGNTEDLNAKIKFLLSQNKDLKLSNQELKENIKQQEQLKSEKARDKQTIEQNIEKETEVKEPIKVAETIKLEDIKENVVKEEKSVIADYVNEIDFVKKNGYPILGILLVIFLLGYKLGSLRKEKQLLKHFGGVKVW